MQMRLSKIGRFAGMVLWLTAACAAGRPALSHADDDAEFFEKKVRPILVSRCEACHSSAKGKTSGGLALDSRKGWRAGGDSGPPIVPGKADESLLIQAIRHEGDGPRMPPKDAGGKLAESEIAILTEWVRRGAHDPREGAGKRGGLTENELRNWWSFQPLNHQPGSPDLAGLATSQAIDSLIRTRLDAGGLKPTPEADRRTLIRRATYDLTGLPPSPEEVDAFLADDSTEAYPALIERLLKSPLYGERWGRHWLDVVRYADTAGENTDHPIPDAWRYRNWVIDAFNRDLPYDQFVREQIAGDLIHANDAGDAYAQGIVSTGFLAIARRFDHDADKHMHLTIEDTIDTLGKAFLGLSIACARCHDHKYDPISATDYYALYGILNSTRYAFPGCEAKQQPRDLVPLLSPADWAKTIEPFDKQLAALDAELKQLEEAQGSQAKEFQSATVGSVQSLSRGEIADGGTKLFQEADGGKLATVAVKPGELIQLTIDASGNYGADTTSIEWEIVEVGDKQRKWNLTEDVIRDFLAGNPHADRQGNKTTWLFLDGRGGPSLLPESVAELSGKGGLSAWRKGDNPAVFVNSTDEAIKVWTTLPARTLFVHPAPDGPVALGWVSPMDGQVAITGRIVDAHPGGPNGVGWNIEHIAGNHAATLSRMAELGSRRTQVAASRAELVARAPARPTAYAVTEGTIADAKLHLRGDPEKLGESVPRRWLELFGGEPVSKEAGSGRLQLAGWLSDARNPLASRVMVNRIWQQHFGKGIVPTPNDFGTRGQLPTHPELLDALAARFIASGWSVKEMHRQIMLSETYRRSVGTGNPDDLARGLAVDPNNTLYWRFDRHRLDAEELRDTLLVTSQQLDLIPGGPHPVPPATGWSYTQHGPFTGVAETDKRSIYQMTLRNRRNPFMGLFDGADPNATTPQRQVTTVPTQSLYFLNDGFFHSQAEKVARRALSQPDDSARLNALFRITLQRSPTASERESANAFLTGYAAAVADVPPADQPVAVWSAYTRILLASNEFLYLD
ncbi:MAG: PSD1 and planctomycete cytochrome C domain-containing protein [Planctomycetota bacterium]|nr:PSD1 and planctomycete cytochrome C domain-containing protein [Planctomycetota bacterium]